MSPGYRQGSSTEASASVDPWVWGFLQPMFMEVLENPHLSKPHSLDPQQAWEPQGRDPSRGSDNLSPDLSSHLCVRDFMPLSECVPGFTVYPPPTHPFSEIVCASPPSREPPTPQPSGRACSLLGTIPALRHFCPLKWTADPLREIIVELCDDCKLVRFIHIVAWRCLLFLVIAV